MKVVVRWGLVCSVLLATVCAQRTRVHVDPENGFRIRVPRWLEAIPVKPGDSQLLAKFEGTKKSDKRGLKGELQLILMVARIPRTDGPTTGDDQKEDPKSLADQKVRHLNSSRTLPEFLSRRGYKSDVRENDELFRRPLEDKAGRPYKVYDLKGNDGRFGLIRGFVVEDSTELFGVVALGAGVDAFHREVVGAVRSLERGEFEADEDDVDVYAGSQLRDLDRRREVREALVRGWDAYDTENFILVTNVTRKRTIENMLADLEIMRAAYLERFPPVEGADMDAVSTVRVCDGYDDYLKYAGQRKDGTGGYWAFVDEELVLFNPEKKVPKARPWLAKVDPIAVLYHEAMHQYFHYSNGNLAPGSWFNEGYGEVFGGAQVDRRKGKIKRIKTNKFRMAWIKRARKQGAWPDLAAFLRVPQHKFYGPSSLQNYAFAWAFCYFLEQQRLERPSRRNDQWASIPEVYLGHLRRITAKYRAKLPDDAPNDWIVSKQDEIQVEAYEATFADIDMLELEKAWIDFMKKLR